MAGGQKHEPDHAQGHRRKKTLSPRMKLQFLFRFDRPFFWPAAGLNPEPQNGFCQTYNKSAFRPQSFYSAFGFVAWKKTSVNLTD
jgi:hypothetical protein